MLTSSAMLDAGVFDKAEAVLLRILAAEPRNARALAKLGDFRRRRGDFPGALKAYRRLRAVAPDDATAAWSIAVLGGARLPDAGPPGCRAAPFVRMTNFLSPAACDRLLAEVLAASERFVPAQVLRPNESRGVVDRKLRNASRFGRADLRSWFVPKLHGVLPEVLGRLRMEHLDVGHIELDVTVHRRGDFFVAHRDNDAAHRDEEAIRRLLHLRTRKLSYVYYFYRDPRPFAGGDLLLYDATDAGRKPHAAFSRIDPTRNSIVFFPSDCWHEVTPVACGDELEDGRFTVNGWIHPRRAAHTSAASHRQCEE